MRYRWMRWLSVLVLVAGCSDRLATGSLELTIYGEDFIEQEIPAALTAGDEGFVDGWSVRFSKFLVSVGDVRVEDQGGDLGALASTAQVFDLHQPGPHLVESFEDVGAQRWDRVSFSIAPPSGEASAGNATEEDFEMMRANGYSVYVEGAASNGGDERRFSWGFETATTYEACQHDDFGEGVVVPSGGMESAEITIHGDHLFYDDLQAPDTVLRFEAMSAADTDNDSEVTLEELAMVDLTILTEGTYGTGGAGEVEHLGAFVVSLTRTLGHWRGEGHCHSGATQAH